MKYFHVSHIGWISIITLLFFIAVGFDVSPYIRGPAPYPPEWRWDYLYINTLDRIYFPIICLGLYFGLFRLSEIKKTYIKKHILVFLIALVLLSFVFQLSVLFFSRAGIPVLIHRIINPDLNGYFTASLGIQNIFDFLATFNQKILSFNYHAASHPPGAILIFFFIKQALSFVPFVNELVNYLSPTHTDVKEIWITLLPSEKATAVFSAFFIPFLSSLTIIPLYYSAKILYDTKIALRSVFIYILIPSIVLFIPINDSFLPIFAATAFLFLLKGINQKKPVYFFLCGITLFLGSFFSLSLMPLAIFYTVFYFLVNYSHLRFKNIISDSFLFFLGIILIPVLLYFIFHFNFPQMMNIIVDTVPHIHTRSYSTWIFYNLVDFLIFAGIPISITLILCAKHQLLAIFGRKKAKIDSLFIAFFITLAVINFSGSMRGEAGRILSILMPFTTLIGASFVSRKLKFTSAKFGIFLFLLALQILVLQEFWVMLW